MSDDRQNQSFDLGQMFNQGWASLNERKLELQQPNGRTLFQLPLAWALLIGLFALVAQLLVPLLIAVVVLLVLKFKFVLRRRLPNGGSDGPPSQA